MEIFGDIKNALSQVLLEELPGVESHLKMVPPGRKTKVGPNIERQAKQSSVLIILYPNEGRLFCVLIKRPATMKFHAGQIAFPGGMIEESDQSLIDTALREAHEEVGIAIQSVEVIGQLSRLYVSVSNFSILPFIGWCEAKPILKQNFHEVDKIILFPVSEFLPGKGVSIVSMETFTGKTDVPCFLYQEEIIWGATAMILSELLDVLKKIS